MRHNEKSEDIARGRRLLVVASQTVGVVAVHRPHRRPNPFVSGQSFHFQMTVALGEALLFQPNFLKSYHIFKIPLIFSKKVTKVSKIHDFCV